MDFLLKERVGKVIKTMVATVEMRRIPPIQDLIGVGMPDSREGRPEK